MSFTKSSRKMEDDNNSKPPVLLDSGDLRLLVSYSNQNLTLLGSSQALSLASPVLGKFLNPPFPKLVSKEGGIDNIQDKQIDFSEDDGEALLLLLRIAHLQFNKVPSNLEPAAILNVAILCDQYDCVGIVKPWLPLWLVNVAIQINEPGYEKWLFVAWVFGREKLFHSVATKLLREMKTNDEGKSLTSNGEVLPSPMPPYIIESIMSIRHDTIQGLLKVPYDYVSRFERDKDNRICKSKLKQCDAIVYGSLLIGLQHFGLWPRQSPDTIHISVQDLASQLISIEIFPYRTHDRTHDSYHYDRLESRHDRCIVPMEIASLLSALPDPVLESQRRYIRIQDRK